MKKLCTYNGCKNIVSDGGSRCEQHPREKIVSRRERPYQWVYGSSKWKRLREVFLLLHPLCLHCEQIGLITEATVVDHIKEISDGGPIWDPSNFQPLCRNCHQIKTGMMQRKRAEAKKLNGFGRLSDF